MPFRPTCPHQDRFHFGRNCRRQCAHGDHPPSIGNIGSVKWCATRARRPFRSNTEQLMLKLFCTSVVALTALTGIANAQDADEMAKKGAAAYQLCAACHSLQPGASGRRSKQPSRPGARPRFCPASHRGDCARGAGRGQAASSGLCGSSAGACCWRATLASSTVLREGKRHRPAPPRKRS
jgi:hypothetical protein